MGQRGKRNTKRQERFPLPSESPELIDRLVRNMCAGFGNTVTDEQLAEHRRRWIEMLEEPVKAINRRNGYEQ